MERSLSVPVVDDQQNANPSFQGADTHDTGTAELAVGSRKSNLCRNSPGGCDHDPDGLLASQLIGSLVRRRHADGGVGGQQSLSLVNGRDLQKLLTQLAFAPAADDGQLRSSQRGLIRRSFANKARDSFVLEHTLNSKLSHQNGRPVQVVINIKRNMKPVAGGSRNRLERSKPSVGYNFYKHELPKHESSFSVNGRSADHRKWLQQIGKRAKSNDVITDPSLALVEGSPENGASSVLSVRGTSHRSYDQDISSSSQLKLAISTMEAGSPTEKSVAAVAVSKEAADGDSTKDMICSVVDTFYKFTCQPR